MSKPRSVVYQRMGAALGIATPILAFTCILTAIASYPAFNWTNNALSDLGIIPGVTGSLFNFGLYASGFFAFNFAIFGLFNYIGKSLFGKIAAATFAAATLSLMAIGIFNESFSPTHYLVSASFFTLLPISLWIIAAAFWLKHEKQMALFTLAASLAAAAPWILYFTIHYVHGVAIPEFLSGLAGSVWIVVLGIKMIKSTSQSKA